MELCIGGETMTQDLSDEPKMKTQGENLTSVESVESFFTKNWLLQKSDCNLCSPVWVQKYLEVTVGGIFQWHGLRHSLACLESIRHHCGPLRRPRGPKNENLGAQRWARATWTVLQNRAQNNISALYKRVYLQIKRRWIAMLVRKEINFKTNNHEQERNKHMPEHIVDHHWDLDAQKMRTDNMDTCRTGLRTLFQHPTNVYVQIKRRRMLCEFKNSRYSLVIVCSYIPWRVKLMIGQRGLFCCAHLPWTFCIIALHCSSLSWCGKWKVKEHVQFYQKPSKSHFWQNCLFSLFCPLQLFPEPVTRAL